MVSKVREYIKGSNGEPISFASFIPEPKDLKGEATVNINGYDISIPAWLEWRINNWGTKWDAYDICEEATDRLAFSTANSSPCSVIEHLSKVFPEVTFHMTFADEFVGQCCGEYTFLGGNLVDEVYIHYEESDRAMEYYFLTHESEREFWKKNEAGEWVEIEDEEEETEVESDMEYTYVE